jgi:hypothetical protein
MPSSSKSQQRLFGLIRKCQKEGKCLSPKIRKMAKKINPEAVRDFAKTKHKKLPERKHESFLNFKDWLVLRENSTN